MLTLTHSAGECYRSCPRKYFHRYERQLRRVEERAEALELGTLLHHGLEMVCRGVGDGVASAYATLQMSVQRDDQVGAELAAIAAEMLRGYVARWPRLEQVVGVEVPFMLPVAGRRWRGVRQAGKMDGVQRVPGGLRLIEHKSAVKVNGGYLEKLWSDTQITGYCRAGSQFYGEPILSVLYDVVLKPPFRRGDEEPLELYQGRCRLAYSKGRTAGRAIRRKTSESDLEYLARIETLGEPWDGYVREEVRLSPADLERWTEDFSDLVDSIRRSRRTGRWPHYTRACFDWNRACEYLPICRAGSLEACGVEYEVIEDEHPELGNPAQLSL